MAHTIVTMQLDDRRIAIGGRGVEAATVLVPIHNDGGATDESPDDVIDPNDDNDGYCIVGDDLDALIKEAYEFLKNSDD